MARVSKEVTTAIEDHIRGKVPKDVMSKCGHCNETLTHWINVTMVEVKETTGKTVPLKTTTDIFTKVYNEDKLPHDKITPESFKEKVRYHSGDKDENTENLFDQNDQIKKSHDKKRKKKTERRQENLHDDVTWMRRERIADKRKEAIKKLGVGKFMNLSKFNPWPTELVGFIRRSNAAKFHPDNGGTNEAYQKFESYLEALETPYE